MKKKIRVGVLFGGRSGEHEVSLRSAASIIEAIDRNKYEVLPIGITKEGRWLTADASQKLLSGHPLPLPRADAGETPETVKTEAGVLERGLPMVLAPDPTQRSAAERAVDVVFPVLHGTFGEDGTVQGLLELAGLAYVGAGVLGSAVGMDKEVMKRLFREARLPVAPWMTFLRSEIEARSRRVTTAIENRFRYPVFVKPANMGSSVGISKVHNAGELKPALELAAEFDRKVIVERGLDARELECSVLGNDQPEASVPGEIIPVNEFYDYDAKYLKEGSELIIPAKIPAALAKQVRKLAVAAFKAVDCAGMARVDFLLERRTGKIYVNEVNTIPGFTSISMFPKLWEASGVPYPELIDRLIVLALERHGEKRRTRFGIELPEAGRTD
jgi:D-alanine-D-alanine ligase